MAINKRRIKQEYPYYMNEIKDLGATSKDIEAMKTKGYIIKSGKNYIFLGKLLLQYCQEKKEQLTEHDFQCSRCKKIYQPALDKEKDLQMIGQKYVAILQCPFCNNKDKPWIDHKMLVEDGAFYLPRFKRKPMNISLEGSYNRQNVILTRKVINRMIGKGYSSKTISNMLSALNGFQKFINYKDYTEITEDDILAFSKHLDQKKLTTKASTMKCLNMYFSHVIDKKNRFSSLVDLFSISQNEKRRLKEFKTELKLSEEEVINCFNSIDDSKDSGKRLKCIIAVFFCSGIRRETLLSLDLKALRNFPRICLSARDMQYQTKYSKFNDIVLLNLNQEFLEYIPSYIRFLVKERGFSEKDPLIPQLEKYKGQDNLQFSKNFIKSGNTISKLLKDSGRQIGMLNGNPHQFRHLSSYLVKKRMENLPVYQLLKVIGAMPKNLLHNNLDLLFYRYGQESEEQKIQTLIDTDFSGKEKDNREQESLIQKNKRLLESIHEEGDVSKLQDTHNLLQRILNDKE